MTIALHGALLMQFVKLSERRIMHTTGWKIKSFEAIKSGKNLRITQNTPFPQEFTRTTRLGYVDGDPAILRLLRRKPLVDGR